MARGLPACGGLSRRYRGVCGSPLRGSAGRPSLPRGKGKFRLAGVVQRVHVNGHDGVMTEMNSYALILFHARFWREAAYLLLGLPLGLLWFIYAVTMYSVGASLVIVWVGVPLLVFTHVSMRWIGAVRARAR